MKGRSLMDPSPEKKGKNYASAIGGNVHSREAGNKQI